jgi:hypothetical protein
VISHSPIKQIPDRYIGCFKKSFTNSITITIKFVKLFRKPLYWWLLPLRYFSILVFDVVQSWDTNSHKPKNKEKMTRSDKHSSLDLHFYCWDLHTLYSLTYQLLCYYQHCRFILIHLVWVGGWTVRILRILN